jgi:hypothetical protein
LPAEDGHPCQRSGHEEQDCWKKKEADGGKPSTFTGRKEVLRYGNVASLPALSMVAAVSTGDKETPLRDRYDHEDFMMSPELVYPLVDKYGPFTLDGAADSAGNNAQDFCDDWCHRDGDSFLERDVSGEAVYLNPPFRRAGTFLKHYLKCKDKDRSTLGLFILPHDPDASWWPLVSHMEVVATWAAGTQLFTLTGKRRDTQWKAADCALAARAVHSPSSGSARQAGRPAR